MLTHSAPRIPSQRRLDNLTLAYAATLACRYEDDSIPGFLRRFQAIGLTPRNPAEVDRDTLQELLELYAFDCESVADATRVPSSQIQADLECLNDRLDTIRGIVFCNA